MYITESRTGQKLFECNLPEDFQIRASKSIKSYPNNQKIHLEIIARKNQCRITYQTGESYMYEKKIFQSPFKISQPHPLGTQDPDGVWYTNLTSLYEDLDHIASSVAQKSVTALSYFNLPDRVLNEMRSDFQKSVSLFVNQTQILGSFQAVPVGSNIRNYLFEGGMGVYEADGKAIAVCIGRNGLEVDVMQMQGVYENITGEPFGRASDSPYIVSSTCMWDIPFIYTFVSDNKDDITIFMEFVESMKMVPQCKKEIEQLKEKVSQYQLQKAQMEAMQNQQMWNMAFAQQQQQFAAMDRLTQSIHQDLDSFHNNLFAQMQQNDARIHTGPQYAGGESLDDKIQRMRHESMMGVDTYDRDDGTTVEYSTMADRVFENNLDSTQHFGTHNYYDDFVPDGWHELKKK